MAISDALKSLDLDELRTMRSSAITAIAKLHTGTRAVSATGLDGRSMTYTQSSARDLECWINQLSTAIAELEGAAGPALAPVLPEVV